MSKPKRSSVEQSGQADPEPIEDRKPIPFPEVVRRLLAAPPAPKRKPKRRKPA